MTSRNLLLLAVVSIVVIWQLPYGPQAMYPFALFATYAHELGHGLTALLVGATFDRLMIYADGSGLAIWHGHPGRLSSALVAAGGLLGPSALGTLLLAFSRAPRHARLLLASLALMVLLTVLFWVRNLFGILFLIGVSGFFAFSAKALSDAAALFLLHLVAALLCLAWFRDLGYMFSAGAVVHGIARPSDSAVMAEALWLPYWFWGGLVAVISLAMLVLGLWISTRVSRGAAR